MLVGENPATACASSCPNMRVGNLDDVFDSMRELIPKVQDDTERGLVVSAILVLGDQGLSVEQRELLQKKLRKMSKLAEGIFDEGAYQKSPILRLGLIWKQVGSVLPIFGFKDLIVF